MVVEDLARDIKKVRQERITRCVANRRSVLACSHDVLGTEERELLRNERLLQAKLPLDLSDGQLSMDEGLQDSDPHGVRKCPEKLRLEHV